MHLIFVVCDNKRNQLLANRARLDNNGPEYLKFRN